MSIKPQLFKQSYMKLKGTIRLFLEGSEKGLKYLADLHQSGELQALLNELKSDNMHEIIVTKTELTTDAKVIEVIEKDELIKAIREGTIDKTTLQQVDLSGANLWGAFLKEADLWGAFLREADLSGADLSGADVENAIFIDAAGITSEQEQDLIQRGAILLRNSNVPN